MDDETTFSTARVRELLRRAILGPERTPEMLRDIDELAVRFDPAERAVIGRFLVNVRRVADRHARTLWTAVDDGTESALGQLEAPDDARGPHRQHADERDDADRSANDNHGHRWTSQPDRTVPPSSAPVAAVSSRPST